jgi:hypothetical protein
MPPRKSQSLNARKFCSSSYYTEISDDEASDISAESAVSIKEKVVTKPTGRGKAAPPPKEEVESDNAEAEEDEDDDEEVGDDEFVPFGIMCDLC